MVIDKDFQCQILQLLQRECLQVQVGLYQSLTDDSPKSHPGPSTVDSISNKTHAISDHLYSTGNDTPKL